MKDSLVRTFDDAVYYFFGYTDLWAFFDNEHTPLQIRYIRPDYLSKADFFYNTTNHIWYTSYYNPIVKRIPWITSTLTVGDKTYDLSEFVMNQKVQISAIRPLYPSPDMLVAAWCLQEGIWFSFDERCDATLTVMDDNCEEHVLGLIVNSDEEVDLFGKSIGIENYSRGPDTDTDADDSAATSTCVDADADPDASAANTSTDTGLDSDTEVVSDYKKID
jgi:hypothetical protein